MVPPRPHAVAVALLVLLGAGDAAAAGLQVTHGQLGPVAAAPLPETWVELKGASHRADLPEPGLASEPALSAPSEASAAPEYKREAYPMRLAAMRVERPAAAAKPSSAARPPVALPRRLNQSLMSLMALPSRTSASRVDTYTHPERVDDPEITRVIQKQVAHLREVQHIEDMRKASAATHPARVDDPEITQVIQKQVAHLEEVQRLEEARNAATKANRSSLANAVEAAQQKQIDGSIGAIRARVAKLENAMKFISDSSRSCDDVMNANNKEEFCSDRQERCGDAFLSTEDFKCCGGGEGGLECADRPAIVTQCSPALRGALMAITQSQMTTCARAHNVNIGIKRRPAAEPPQVPVLITAVYPAYIEATNVHRKDARWCGCAAEFDGMGLPQENLEAGKDVNPARGNFPPVAGKDATIKRATNLNIDGKKGGGAGPNKGPSAKQGHLMAEFMSRRQTLLAQHRSLRVLPANRTVVEQSELNPMGFPAQPRGRAADAAVARAAGEVAREPRTEEARSGDERVEVGFGGEEEEEDEGDDEGGGREGRAMGGSASFLQVGDDDPGPRRPDARSGSFPPAIEELFARYQAVNIDVKDNEFIDTNGWPFSMRTPAPVAPADSDGTACRFSVQTLYHSGRLEFIAFCDYAWKYPLMTVMPWVGVGVG